MKVLLNLNNCPDDDRYCPDIDTTGSQKVTEVNIGPGADWIVTLIEYADVFLTLFSLPTVIKDGIKDWKWLIEKLRGFRSRKEMISVDEDGAACLAIDYLAEKYGEDAKLEIICHYIIPLADLSGMIHFQEETFASHPYDYYIQAYRVNSIIKILGIRATGEIRELESFEVTAWGVEDI